MEVTADSGKYYLVKCIRSLLNLPEDPKSLMANRMLDDFISSQEQLSLSIC